MFFVLSKMLRVRILLFIYFVGFLQIFSDAAFIEGDSSCTLLKNCPHVAELVRTRRDSYAVITLLNLIHCSDRNYQIRINCISPEKLKDFMDRADLIPNYDDCGLELPEEKLARATVTNIDEYPWVALLRYRIKAEVVAYGCHASLITKRYLLSAGHCVDPIHTQAQVGGKLWSVVLGEYDLRTAPDCIKTFCNVNATEIMVESYHIHPGYNLAKNKNDIALIRMEREVQLSEFIGIICLPPKNLLEPFNESLWIAAWGQNEAGNMIPVKSKAVVKVREHSACKVNKKLSSKQFCAGPTNGTQTCAGDSGGPLMMRRTLDDANRLFLVGVYSQGVPCFFRNNVSIFTKVSPYIEWIVTTIHK